MTLRGIDISEWQRTTPDLTGLAFVWCRASWGITADAMYPTHKARVRSAGLVLGAYHYGGHEPIRDQLAAFLSSAGPADLWALDVEAGNMTDAEARAFIAAFQATGRRIALYHSGSGFPDYGQNYSWIADWTGEPSVHWTFWQWRGSPLDQDLFAGDRAALLALTGKVDPMFRRKAEGWKAGSAGARRYDSPGGQLVGTLPAGTLLTSIGETMDGAWRLVAISGTAGVDPVWQYVPRGDLVPLVQGGDPAFDAAVQALLIARQAPGKTYSQAEVDAMTHPLQARIDAARAALA